MLHLLPILQGFLTERNSMMARMALIQDKIVKLSPVFSKTAVDCVSAFFGKEATIKMPWEIVEQLQCQFDKILTMGSACKDYSAITVAGIQNDSLSAFIDEENVSNAYATDILGEFVNTYLGMLADNEDFNKNFGYLAQAVPILYTDGNSYLPFIWGIQGYLYIDSHWIYMGYSIRENTQKSSS